MQELKGVDKAHLHTFGKPQRIRMENEPKFVGRLAEQWSEANGIVFKYIEPDKPMQHAYIERFNNTYLNG